MLPQSFLLWALLSPSFFIVVKLALGFAQLVWMKKGIEKVSIRSILPLLMGAVINYGMVEQWYSTPYRNNLLEETRLQATAEQEFYGRQCDTLPAMDEDMVKLCNGWRKLLNSTAMERAFTKVLQDYSQSAEGVAHYISNDWLMRISAATLLLYFAYVIYKRICAYIYFKDYRKAVKAQYLTPICTEPQFPSLKSKIM